MSGGFVVQLRRMPDGDSLVPCPICGFETMVYCGDEQELGCGRCEEHWTVRSVHLELERVKHDEEVA